jgi:hypothetical protein
VRKAIARVNTVYRQTQISALKAKVSEDAKNKKGKAYLPLDLRPKKTRAIRKRLTKAQVGERARRALSDARPAWRCSAAARWPRAHVSGLAGARQIREGPAAAKVGAGEAGV